jgi:4-alpha-glucanotransferase
MWTAPRACRTTTPNTADPSQAGFNPQSGAHISGRWHSRTSRGFRHFFSWQRRLAGRLFASYGGQGVYKDGVRSDWDLEIRQRDSSALGEWRQKLSAGMEVHKFAQFEFFSQWKKLRDESQSHGISIMGDIPIYRSASLPTVPMFRPIRSCFVGMSNPDPPRSQAFRLTISPILVNCGGTRCNGATCRLHPVIAGGSIVFEYLSNYLTWCDWITSLTLRCQRMR